MPAASEPANPPRPTQAPSPALPPVGEDHPDAPAFLPKDEVIGAWVRAQAADVYPPDRLEAVVENRDRLAAIRSFGVKQATTTAYAWKESGEVRLVRLLLIETQSPLDAMGVLTVHCLAANNAEPGVVNRAQANGVARLSVWQGNFFLHMQTHHADDAFLERCSVFLRKLILRIPGDEAPAWTKLLPIDGRLPGQFWLVRRVGALRGTSGQVLGLRDHETLDDLIRLDPDGALAVAAYRVPDETRPNIIWLGAYPDPDRAVAAYERYTEFLNRSQAPHALNTLLDSPHGRFLLGSWTADQESITNRLPDIASRLPD